MTDWPMNVTSKSAAATGATKATSRARMSANSTKSAPKTIVYAARAVDRPHPLPDPWDKRESLDAHFVALEAVERDRNRHERCYDTSDDEATIRAGPIPKPHHQTDECEWRQDERCSFVCSRSRCVAEI